MTTITKTQARKILTVLRKLDASATMHTDYSGKFMFEQNCLGYSARNGAHVGAAVAIALAGSKVDVMALVEKACTDTLAFDEIVYFPSIRIGA
jgi:hypothetical protein